MFTAFYLLCIWFLLFICALFHKVSIRIFDGVLFRVFLIFYDCATAHSLTYLLSDLCSTVYDIVCFSVFHFSHPWILPPRCVLFYHPCILVGSHWHPWRWCCFTCIISLGWLGYFWSLLIASLVLSPWSRNGFLGWDFVLQWGGLVWLVSVCLPMMFLTCKHARESVQLCYWINLLLWLGCISSSFWNYAFLVLYKIPQRRDHPVWLWFGS